MTDTTRPVALVTGASRGIGAAIACRLGREGFHVLVNYASNEAKAQKVLDEITQNGGSGELCGFDISNDQEIEAKFSEIHKKHSALAVLVNNAGITIDGLLLRQKTEDLDKTLQIDLRGAMLCTREAAKKMVRAKSGSIIQISSVVGESGNPGQSAYAAAKSGLIGYTKSVAKELASRGIRANVITPGFIGTDMTESLTPDQKEAIFRSIPLGYMGEPEDIAASVAFLASPDSRYITGQVLGVNGGMYM